MVLVVVLVVVVMRRRTLLIVAGRLELELWFRRLARANPTTAPNGRSRYFHTLKLPILRHRNGQSLLLWITSSLHQPITSIALAIDTSIVFATIVIPIASPLAATFATLTTSNMPVMFPRRSTSPSPVVFIRRK